MREYEKLRSLRDRLQPRFIEVRDGLSEVDRRTNDERLKTLTDEIADMSRLARNEGLLALEERAEQYRDQGGFKESLYKTLMLIVDGTDSEIVEDIMTIEYLSDCLDGYDAAEYLMMLYGLLLLQAGTETTDIISAMDSFLNEKAEGSSKEGWYYDKLGLVERELLSLRRDKSLDELEKADEYLLQTVYMHQKAADILRKYGDREVENFVNEIAFCDQQKESLGVAFFRYAYRQFLLGLSYSETMEKLTTKYYSISAKGYEALAILMTMCQIKCINEGHNPRVIQEYMVAFLPPDLRKRYDDELWEKYETYYTSMINRYHQRGKETPTATTTEEETGKEWIDELNYADSYATHLLNYALEHIEDIDIQRLLRDVRDSDLCIALKGASSGARSKVLRNLSDTSAEMIVNEMEYMGPVRMVDVCEAQHKILGVLIKLLNNGELQVEKYPFMDAFIHNVKIGDYQRPGNFESDDKKEMSDFRRIYLEICTDEVEWAKSGSNNNRSNHMIELVNAIILNTTSIRYDRAMRMVENDLLGPLIMSMEKDARNILARDMAQCRIEYIRDNYSNGEFRSYDGAEAFLKALEKRFDWEGMADIAYMIREFLRLMERPGWGDSLKLYRFSDSARLLELISKVEE